MSNKKKLLNRKKIYNYDELMQIYNYSFSTTSFENMPIDELNLHKYALIFVLMLETGMDESEIYTFTWEAFKTLVDEGAVICGSNINDIKSLYVITGSAAILKVFELINQIEDCIKNCDENSHSSTYMLPRFHAISYSLKQHFRLLTHILSIPNYDIESLKDTFIVLTITYYFPFVQRLNQRFNYKNLSAVIKKYFLYVDDNMFNLANKFLTYNSIYSTDFCDLKKHYGLMKYRQLLLDFESYNNKSKPTELLLDFFNIFPNKVLI